MSAGRIPAFFEIATAVSILSPVHIIVLIPAFLHLSILSIIPGLSGSINPKIPTAVRSYSRISLSPSFSKLLLSLLIFSNSSIEISL